MEVQYLCQNNNCSYPGDTKCEIRFKAESIMDNNNLATVFCPFCKTEMMPSYLNDIVSDPTVKVQGTSH